jgi:hypothetical protein
MSHSFNTENEHHVGDERDIKDMMIDGIDIVDLKEKTAKKWVYFDVETGRIKF